jgi:hypothetical protein
MTIGQEANKLIIRLGIRETHTYMLSVLEHAYIYNHA